MKKILLIILGILILLSAGYFIWVKFFKFTKTIEPSVTNLSTNLTIPDKILQNKFGFLGGGSGDDGTTISATGAAWVRPHPGPFLWDAMQKNGDTSIDFSATDQMVKNYQKNDLGILATLWPFADWEQGGEPSCKVYSGDEFLPKNDKKDRGDYLPEYRCNPHNWDLYQKWVSAIIERYDGDGNSDMDGLKYPIKHWEVMNEPDLVGPIDSGGGPSLTFYMQGPEEYGELLIKSNQAIKQADSSANVLIAGAAGAENQFLNFYKNVFNNKDTLNAFDIGNIHCISNDQTTHDFNIGAYKSMLGEYKINKPIWVTEAEAFYGNANAEQNLENTKTSTQNALKAGAGRIFYTRYNFQDSRTDMSEKSAESKDSITESIKWYKEITATN